MENGNNDQDPLSEEVKADEVKTDNKKTFNPMIVLYTVVGLTILISAYFLFDGKSKDDTSDTTEDGAASTIDETVEDVSSVEVETTPIPTTWDKLTVSQKLDVIRGNQESIWNSIVVEIVNGRAITVGEYLFNQKQNKE